MNYFKYDNLKDKEKFHVGYYDAIDEISTIREYGLQYEFDNLFQNIESKSIKERGLKAKTFDHFIVEYGYRNYMFHPDFGESVIDKVEHLNYLIELDTDGFWNVTYFYYRQALARLNRDYPQKEIKGYEEGSNVLDAMRVYHNMLMAFKKAFEFDVESDISADHENFVVKDISLEEFVDDISTDSTN